MIELTPEIIDWIDLNAKADTLALRLKHAGDKIKSEAILQIECRRKAASKLKQTLQCKNFVFPTSLSAEQCTSDSIAAFHATLVKGNTVLDMTCGLCIDAFHIAASGKTVTAIDINPEVAAAAGHNAAALGIDTLHAICADSTAWLDENGLRFDTIFIDPARRGDCGKRLFAISDCEPDVTSLLPLLASRCSRLIVKASPMLDITETVRSLGRCSHLYIIGTPTECKEIVAVMDFDSEGSGEPTISAVTISADRTVSFPFTKTDELVATAGVTAAAAPGNFLHVPYPATMKSGAFNLLATRCNVRKLHPDTHYYISAEPQPDFPGNIFQITETIPFSKAAIKHIRQKYPVINISARNFPLSSTDLAKRLKIKEGGELRLFAATDAEGPKIIIASP